MNLQNGDAAKNDALFFRFRSYTIRRPIAYAYLLSTLYNVTFFVQFMTSPYVIKELGISDKDYGYIQTVFGLLQVCGGPVFGYITQQFGIRIALYLCYGSTLLSALMLYGTNDLTTMYISRLPVFFMHGQQAHQTLLSLLTSPGKERTNAFGRMGLTFGALLTSAALGLLPFVIVETCLDRKDYDHTIEDSKVATTVPAATLSWSNAVGVLKRPGTLNILIKKNAPIMPMLLVFSILQIYMINEFKVTPDVNSGIQMLTGVCIMLSNGFGVIFLRKHLDEQKLLLLGTCCFIGAYLLLAAFTRLWLICVIMPFACFGMSLVATVADSLLTTLVDEHEQGVVLGVATAVNSFVRTFAPAISGVIMDRYGFAAFGVIGLVGALLGVFACVASPIDDRLLRKGRSKSYSEKEE